MNDAVYCPCGWSCHQREDGSDSPCSFDCIGHDPLILRADRDRLASRLEKLRPYLRHHPECLRLCTCANNVPHPCDCGLADLLTEIGEQ